MSNLQAYVIPWSNRNEHQNEVDPAKGCTISKATIHQPWPHSCLRESRQHQHEKQQATPGYKHLHPLRYQSSLGQQEKSAVSSAWGGRKLGRYRENGNEESGLSPQQSAATRPTNFIRIQDPLGTHAQQVKQTQLIRHHRSATQLCPGPSGGHRYSPPLHLLKAQ